MVYVCLVGIDVSGCCVASVFCGPWLSDNSMNVLLFGRGVAVTLVLFVLLFFTPKSIQSPSYCLPLVSCLHCFDRELCRLCFAALLLCRL